MIKVKAKVYFFNHGNEIKSKVYHKYRPAFKFGNESIMFSGSILVKNDNKYFLPGEQKIIEILFNQNESTERLINTGKTFGIYEAPLKFGEGEILDVELNFKNS